MSNDESLTQGATRRGGRAKPASTPRPRDRSSVSSNWVPNGQVLKDKERIPCVTHCTWVCSVCGRETYWPTKRAFGKEGITHGGPPERSFDRRFGWLHCRDSKYPDHKRYLGKIDGKPGPVIAYHSGMTFSEQPVQDDESLKEFLPDAKSIPEPPKRKGRAPRSQGIGKEIRAARAKGRVLGTGERSVRLQRAGRRGPKTAAT